MRRILVASALTLALAGGQRAFAQVPFFFSTGDPDGKIATASRPDSPAGIEIESADDFILKAPTTFINSATFTGLVPTGSSVSQVVVEVYRVFPKDSDTVRTINVPTRTNSPSDVAFDTRDNLAGSLGFTTSVLASSFTAANSVVNGINPKPNQLTGGEGAVTGQEVEFNVTFTTPLALGADHYFFIPQVLLSNGNFLWLSAPRPIVVPGTPITPDLQSWIRNASLDPDWLRVGTDITGTGPFNATFSLTGTAVPEPGSFALLGALAVCLAGFTWRRGRHAS